MTSLQSLGKFDNDRRQDHLLPTSNNGGLRVFPSFPVFPVFLVVIDDSEHSTVNEIKTTLHSLLRISYVRYQRES